ncbi:MAG: serine/threonine protein kinase [Pseudonocardiaceae bacterium]
MTGWSIPGCVHVRQVRVDAVGRRVVARHRKNRRFLWVTYLSQELLADTEFRNRFVVDAERLAHVRDPSVARVHEYVECAEGAAVVADHVEGTPLRELLFEEGALGTEAAVVVLKDVVRGLVAAHAAGLTHGDVKPEDVVLTRAGRARLVDFGLFTCAGRRLLARSTPFYLAPEQWSGGPATQPGDLYAAAVTFFECLVGAPPFHADRPFQLSALHTFSAPPLDAVPASVRELVQYGLVKNPAGRSSARGLLARVEEAALHGLDPGWERRGRRELTRLLARPSHPADVPVVTIPRRRQRNVRLAAVLGGALVVAAGVSSPPFPGVLLPGSGGGVVDSDATPPVLAFPGPPEGPAGVRANAEGPAAERAPDPQSAAMAESVGPTVTTAPGTAVAPIPSASPPRPEIAFSPRPVPADQGNPQPDAPAPVTPTPRTLPMSATPPPATPPVSQEPPTPSEEPAPPTTSDPGSEGVLAAPSGQQPEQRIVRASTPGTERPMVQRRSARDADGVGRAQCGAAERHGGDDTPAQRRSPRSNR